MVNKNYKRPAARLATKRDIGRALFWFHVVLVAALAAMLLW